MARKKVQRFLNRNGRIDWESLLCMIIDDTSPTSLQARFQLPLRGAPQRADVILIKKRGFKVEEATLLPALYSRLDDQNMIELKGGTHTVGLLDPTTLLGYACQYTVQEYEKEHARRLKAENQARSLKRKRTVKPLEPLALKLIFVAPVCTESARRGVELRDGTLTRSTPGVWEGRMGGYPLLFLETEELWKEGHGNLLLFLNTFRGANPEDVKNRMTEAEQQIYNKVIGFVQEGHDTTEEDMRKTVSEKIAERYAEFERQQFEKFERQQLARLTTAQRLEGCPTEEVLAHYAPGEVLAHYAPGEVLAHYAPDERLRGLRPDERLQGLSPEQVLAGLGPEVRQGLLRALQNTGPVSA